MEYAEVLKADELVWLIDNFELYKSTLNWPENLPPIPRSNFKSGTFRYKFHLTYKNVLSDFDYTLDYGNQTLEFN